MYFLVLIYQGILGKTRDAIASKNTLYASSFYQRINLGTPGVRVLKPIPK